MIVGVTGLARSGKDTLADFLVREYGFVKLNMSDCLRDELASRGKEPSKDNMSLLGDEWRSLYGYDIVIRRTLETASNYGNAVITGFRSPEEVSFVRSNCAMFYLVALVASDATRFARRNGLDPQDLASFLARDERDIKNKGLDKVLASADYVIENDTNDRRLFEKAKELMKGL